MAGSAGGKVSSVVAAAVVFALLVGGVLWLFDLVAGWWLVIGLVVGGPTAAVVGGRLLDGETGGDESGTDGRDSLRLLRAVYVAVLVWVVLLLNDLFLMVVALVPSVVVFGVAQTIGHRFALRSVRWLGAAAIFFWIGVVWTFDLDVGSGSRWPTIGGFFVEGLPVIFAMSCCLAFGVFEAGRELRARLRRRTKSV